MSIAYILLVLVAAVALVGCRTTGRFKNLDGSGAPGTVIPAFRMVVIDGLAGRGRSPRTAPMEKVDPDLARISTPPGPGEGVRLTWIGHASWLVQLEGKSFLIDPIFGDLGLGPSGRNVPAGVLPEQLPRIDAVLITHNHYDHLDLPSIQRVGAPVIAGLGMQAYFRRKGVTASELDWWQSIDVGAAKITFVPAQHYSRRGLTDANETLWGGFILEGGGTRIYHSGDTAYFAGFSEIGRRFPNIDAALLPIGAYDPAWFMDKQHMNPEQAVQAYVDLGAKSFFAMHWGTFKLTYEPLDEPPQRLAADWKKRGLAEGQMRILAVGETADVGGAQFPHPTSAHE